MTVDVLTPLLLVMLFHFYKIMCFSKETHFDLPSIRGIEQQIDFMFDTSTSLHKQSRGG